MRTIYVNVNTEGGVGAADWTDSAAALPSYGGRNDRYVVTVPDDVTTAEIADGLDSFLGEYDLPEGWSSEPIRCEEQGGNA